jgi:hypothetical protein
MRRDLAVFTRSFPDAIFEKLVADYLRALAKRLGA